MNWLNDTRIEFGGASVSFGALLLALAVLTVGFFIATKTSKRIRAFGSPAPEDLKWRATFAQVTGHLLRLVSVVVALQVTGVNLASVLAAGAVVAVGIGIAMQKVAENFVSGIILLAERSIREGDIIEFEGTIGRVQHVGIRATIAVTLDDEEMIVPNSVLTQSTVKNLTLTEPIYRLRVGVGIAYASDVDRVVQVLTEAAGALAWRDLSRKPVVLLHDFGTSSLDFEVSVWTSDVWGLRRGRSELRKAIWRALRDNAITIPFPQVDVHFDAARALAGASPGTGGGERDAAAEQRPLAPRGPDAAR